jgi:hypothetical protein
MEVCLEDDAENKRGLCAGGSYTIAHYHDSIDENLQQRKNYV